MAFNANDPRVQSAVAAGIPLSAIANFLSGNPGDESRIMSALGPDYIQGSGASVASYSPAQPYVVPTPVYATPTISSPLTTATPSDATVTGISSGLSLVPSSSTVNVSSGAPQVMSSPGIPMWAILAAFGVLALLFLRK